MNGAYKTDVINVVYGDLLHSFYRNDITHDILRCLRILVDVTLTGCKTST